MKPELSKFAPLGLWLAGISILAAGTFYILNKASLLPVQICLILVVVGLAAFALLDPNRTREALTGRQAKYGSNAFVLTAAVLGLLIIGNIAISGVTKTWDLTEDKANTLSKESEEAVKALKVPVKAEAYFTSRYPKDSARTLLENYKNASGGKLSYEFVDPETNPIRATNAKITRDGTIVLIEGEHTEQVTSPTEQEITNALIRVDNPGTRKVYFLVGHNEYDPTGSGQRASTFAKQLLEGKNYTVATLNLLSDPQIRADASAIIIAGPTTPLSENEILIINAYLEKGGGLVAMSDPSIITQIKDENDPMISFLKNGYGISLGSDLIIDPNINPPVVAVEAAYGSHPITSKLGNQVTAFPTARSVTPFASGDPNTTTTVLVSTSKNSWGETDIDQLNNSKVQFDNGKDLAGPVSVAVASEKSATKSRVVVFGDSDFGGDTYATQYGNADLLMNAIDWAAKQDDLINLSTRQQTTRVMSLNSNLTAGIVGLASVVLIPVLVIITGIVVWVGRRRKG